MQRARRRSKRLWLWVPVLVYGLDAHSQPFRESTRMLSVTKHGGLLSLAAALEKGQTIVLVNLRTREEQECRVVYIGTAQDGTGAVGIEFTGAAPNFWQISFPPLTLYRQPSESHSEVCESV